MKKTISVSIAAALLAACSDEPEVVVVDAPEEGEVSYGGNESAANNWDANGDGLLDREEFLSVSNLAATQWDEDRDQLLTEAEFSTGWADGGFSNTAAAFDTFDEDGSGTVEAGELAGSDRWETWDLNGSGLLESQEFPHY